MLTSMTAKMFAPHDMRPTIEITAFTLASVSTLVVAARFYCRIWIVGRLKIYDYMTLGALLCSWGLCVCNHFQLKFGTGTLGKLAMPSYITTKAERKAYMDWALHASAASWYAYHIGYLFTLASVKLSILVFYLSFATQRTFRILVYVAIVTVSAYTIAMILVNALQCPEDPSYALSSGILINRGAGHCFDLRIVFYFQAGFNMVSDLVILVLPLPLLFRLHMDRLKRLSLLAVFAAGLLVPIASGIRIWGLYIWATSLSSALTRYTGGYVIFWSQVEIHTAIICASVPSLQPVLKKGFHKTSLSLFQRTRQPYYFYADGQNSFTASPIIKNIRDRGPEQDSTDLERPAPTYTPKPPIQELQAPQILVVQHLTNDEVIRERVRAFSNHTTSAYSQPTSPTHPSHIFTNR